jgi:hypothetical protein
MDELQTTVNTDELNVLVEDGVIHEDADNKAE